MRQINADDFKFVTMIQIRFYTMPIPKGLYVCPGKTYDALVTNVNESAISILFTDDSGAVISKMIPYAAMNTDGVKVIPVMTHVQIRKTMYSRIRDAQRFASAVKFDYTVYELLRYAGSYCDENALQYAKKLKPKSGKLVQIIDEGFITAVLGEFGLYDSSSDLLSIDRIPFAIADNKSHTYRVLLTKHEYGQYTFNISVGDRFNKDFHGNGFPPEMMEDKGTSNGFGTHFQGFGELVKLSAAHPDYRADDTLSSNIQSILMRKMDLSAADEERSDLI